MEQVIMRRFGRLFARDTLLPLAIFACSFLAYPVLAVDPVAPPAAPATTQVEALGRTTTAPTTAATVPASTAAKTVHLDEDPNMRIWGRFSPRQMLHMGIMAIVTLNAIGWALLLWAIYRVKKQQRAKRAAATSGGPGI